MKHLLLSLALAVVIVNTTAHAKSPKVRLYKVWVYNLSGILSNRGILYELNDSSITIINSVSKAQYIVQNYQTTPIDIGEINMIKIRQKGRTGREMSYGALAGAFCGILLASNMEDASLSDKAVVTLGLSIVFVPLGTILGAITGNTKEKFDISGSQATYEALKEKLDSFTCVRR